MVNIYHKDAAASDEVQATTLWDRKTDGGFPETKVESTMAVFWRFHLKI